MEHEPKYDYEQEVRDALKLWKRWSWNWLRAHFWNWTFAIAKKELNKIWKETHGLIEKPGDCPDEIMTN